MSTVRDAEGNVLNPRAPQTRRYTDETALVQDWNTLHPEPKVPVKLTASVDGPVRTMDIVTGVKTENGKVVEEFTFVQGHDAKITIRDGEVVDETTDGNNDVPQAGLPSGQSDTRLAGTPTDAEQESPASSESTAGDVPAADEGTEPSV